MVQHVDVNDRPTTIGDHDRQVDQDPATVMLRPPARPGRCPRPRPGHDRGIPSSQGAEWRRGIIRKIAMDPAYIGKRVLRGEIVGDGIWPAIGDEETYWACVRLLEDPSRTTMKSARAMYVPSYIVTCEVCGGQVSCSRGQSKRHIGAYYRLPRNCVRVRIEPLDELAERAVVAWLSQPEVFDLRSGGEDDENVSRARAEGRAVEGRVGGFKQLASIGEVKAVDYARISRGLEAQIAHSGEDLGGSGDPAHPAGTHRPEATAASAAFSDQMAVKRDVLRTIVGHQTPSTGGRRLVVWAAPAEVAMEVRPRGRQPRCLTRNRR
jgi:site-specific DNA recombinase